MYYEEELENAITIKKLTQKLNDISKSGFANDKICIRVNGNVCYAKDIVYEDGEFVIKAIYE